MIDRKIENLVRLEFGIEVLKEFVFTKPLAKDLIHELENEIVNLKNSYLKYDLSEYLITQTKHLKDWIKKYDFNNLPKSLIAI